MAERLPNADRALIDPRKLRDYALNPEHVSGRHKAAYFAQMGYSAEHWQRLERDIREQHLSRPAEHGQEEIIGRSTLFRRRSRHQKASPGRGRRSGSSLTLAPVQIRRMAPEDVLTTRQLPLAS
jgi:hypothetical protein